MKIGVTSQNFKTITGHAGKTRRFLVYNYDFSGCRKEENKIDLPKEMSMHEFNGNEHPLDDLNVLITGSCGEGFIRKMASRDVLVIQTGESDPVIAVEKLVTGESLLPAQEHNH